jgi:hypothetical protein
MKSVGSEVRGWTRSLGIREPIGRFLSSGLVWGFWVFGFRGYSVGTKLPTSLSS